MEPVERIPLMFKLEESLPSKHANYVLTFYDNPSGQEVGTLIFSDEKVSRANKENLFQVSHYLKINEEIERCIPLPEMLRIEKGILEGNEGYFMTFYDEDTKEKLGKYFFEKMQDTPKESNIYKLGFAQIG